MSSKYSAMKKTLIAITSVALITASISSCSKKIDEAYKNPNADVRVPVEKLLPGIISSMAGNSAGHGPLNDIRFVGKFVQYFLFCSAGGEWDQMGNRPGTDNAASMWRVHFYDIGQNCIKMIEWGLEEGKTEYAGVGKAILAWSWLTLSDYHGEVIRHQEAFNTNAITFSYGTQEEIYDHVRNLCHEALAYLDMPVSGSTLSTGDQYFYGGDIAKWKKFVHGVLARSFHHLTNKANYLTDYADSVLYYCDLSINSNADNGMVKFAATGISGNTNFFGPLRGNLASTLIVTESAIRQSAYIANLLSGSNSAFLNIADPRAIYLLRRNANNTFRGLTPNRGQANVTALDRPESFWGIPQTGSPTAIPPYSDHLNNSAPATDNNCRFLFRNASPFPVITASEISFIRAEALYRMGNKAAALVAYKKGIEQNFDMLMNTYSTNVPSGELITPAVRDNFLNNPDVVPSVANLTLTHIMMQKYISLYIHGTFETWVDMRRYHYTDLDPSTGQQVYRDFTPPSVLAGSLYPNNGGKLIYRLRPRFNSEYVWNLNELNRIGASALDYHTKEQWFSKP